LKGPTSTDARSYSWQRDVLLARTWHCPAQKQQQKKIEAYLVSAYCQAKNIPLDNDSEDYFSKNFSAIQTWATSQTAAASVATAIWAYEKLQDYNGLSQALGGFNDALLTYQRIMQLAIGTG
jgi:hypothetical protein